jgi:hypothetical protein
VERRPARPCRAANDDGVDRGREQGAPLSDAQVATGSECRARPTQPDNRRPRPMSDASNNRDCRTPRRRGRRACLAAVGSR